MPAHGYSSNEIGCCEKRLEQFCRVDAYWPYDYLGHLDAVTHPHTVTRRQLYLTNSAMKARSRVRSWEPLLDHQLNELAAIPMTVDLLAVSEGRYCGIREAVGYFYKALTQRIGITDMAAIKVGFLHRPGLIAISDSYVRQNLMMPESDPRWGRDRDQYVGRGLAVLDSIRAMGQGNRTTLAQLERAVSGLVYDGEPARLGALEVAREVPRGAHAHISALRILDIYIWTQDAINNGHPVWVPWWENHRSRCPRSVLIKLAT